MHWIRNKDLQSELLETLITERSLDPQLTQDLEYLIMSSAYYSFLYATKVLEDRFHLGEPAIAAYPKLAIMYFECFRGKMPNGYYIAEKGFAKDAQTALLYSEIRNLPFPEGEDIISLDSELSYLYSGIINRRFPLGEPEIFLDPEDAYRYCSLHGPIPEAEPIISSSPKISLNYATKVLFREFPLGEDAISTDPDLSLEYALHIGRRFLLGERSISLKLYTTMRYVRGIVKGPFPLGEDIISTLGETSFEYATNYLKARFIKGEKEILKSNLRSEYLNFLKTIKSK